MVPTPVVDRERLVGATEGGGGRGREEGEGVATEGDAVGRGEGCEGVEEVTCATCGDDKEGEVDEGAREEGSEMPEDLTTDVAVSLLVSELVGTAKCELAITSVSPSLTLRRE